MEAETLQEMEAFIINCGYLYRDENVGRGQTHMLMFPHFALLFYFIFWIYLIPGYCSFFCIFSSSETHTYMLRYTAPYTNTVSSSVYDVHETVTFAPFLSGTMLFLTPWWLALLKLIFTPAVWSMCMAVECGWGRGWGQGCCDMTPVWSCWSSSVASCHLLCVYMSPSDHLSSSSAVSHHGPAI